MTNQMRQRNRLLELRRAKGIKRQGEFLEILKQSGIEISRTTLCLWENERGGINMKNAHKLAKFFGKPVDEIIYYVPFNPVLITPEKTDES